MDIMRHHAASSHPTSTKATLNLSCQHNRIHASYSRASPALTVRSIPYPAYLAYICSIPSIALRVYPVYSAYAVRPPRAAHPTQHSPWSILYAAFSTQHAAAYPTWCTQHCVQLTMRHTLPGISSIPGIPRTPYTSCDLRDAISPSAPVVGLCFWEAPVHAPILYITRSYSYTST